MDPTRIVIVGGGFAGVACARVVSGAGHEVVLFNQENHMVFQPLLAEVVGASIDPSAVAMPLRQLLPSVRCRTEEVQAIHFEKNKVEYESHDGHPAEHDYDHLVLACGGAVNLALVPGMADHAFPLRTVGDALALRAHVMQQLEKAEVCDHPGRRRWYLSFIVVGGGFSGVEVAGEINDLVRGSRRYFKTIAPDDIAVTLIHSRDQILPEVSPTLRVFARREMERAGIRIRFNARVTMATAEGVQLDGKEMVRGATVVCTIGNTQAALIENVDAEKDRGRLVTEPDMRLSGLLNAWAAGDCAHIINGHDQMACPATGQFAERQGRRVGVNISNVLRGQPTRPFHFKPLGQLCAIGGHRAVAEVFGRRISGFFAWFLWRIVYLFKLPSSARKIKVAFDWTWELVFARDLAHLKANQTGRVGRAHFNAGDVIFRRGDPGTDFYAVQEGEVEVLRESSSGSEPARVVAVLGPGDFFGEMAIVDKCPRNATVRARTNVSVMIMGSGVFSQISTSMAPLRQLIVKAMQLRATSETRLPRVRASLETIPLKELLESVPAAPVSAETPLRTVVSLFKDRQVDICFVVDDRRHLVGILTRTDLFRALDAAPADVSPTAVDSLRAASIMVQPVFAELNETALTALSIMRTRGLGKLPIVESRDQPVLAGYVRVDRIIERVLRDGFDIV